MKLDNYELKKIKGGSCWTVIGIIGTIFLLVGILDGITRPSSCKE